MSRRLVRWTAAVIILQIGLGNTAVAWSDGGHRVIARIAWQQLTPQERRTIGDLIRGNPRFSQDFEIPDNVLPRDRETEDEWLFTQAAVWPDIIRGNPQFHRSTWHYINFPVYLTDEDRDALEEELPANLLTNLPANPENAALNAIQATKLAMSRLKDEDVAAEDKGVYVCWLFHLVGDLHQPLHSSALFSRVAFPNGDRGGNLIRTDAGNLHSYWDGLLGRRMVLNEARLTATQILGDDDLVEAGETALEDLNPEVWALEGNELCEDFAYSPGIRQAVQRREDGTTSVVESVDLSTQYKQQAGALAQRRVAEAGFRLASILKQIAAAQPVVDTPTEMPDLRIVGILPDPNGRDRGAEAIRLKNMTSSAISLSGWKVQDDDGDQLLLTGTIGPNQERVIVDEDAQLPLSNRGETVELVSPSGQVEHRVSYSEEDVERGEFVVFE